MDVICLKDILPIYFARLFPFNELYRWLSYGKAEKFSLREFALNFDGERYLRHQSYKSIDELKKVIKTFHPVKIDIGAIYNISPINHTRQKMFYAIEKELVFDIDITDYDEVRSCCSKADICSKCWKYMIIAIKILDAALREDFGFRHILWVFSGRRGIHCWVCDQRARFLKEASRYAVASYLQLVTGGEYKKKKVNIGDKIHPSVKRALKVIEPVFIPMCIEEQNILGTEEKILKFLGIIDEEEMRIEVKNLLDQYPTSFTKWKAFVEFIQNQLELKSEKWCKTPFLLEEIMIQYAYPRLDINVSLGMQHLLKSPFCVHPKSGKIGVPIDLEIIDQFNPSNVPIITELLEEIDNYDVIAKKNGISILDLTLVDDIQKTSLNKYMKVFRNFLHLLEIATETE